MEAQVGVKGAGIENPRIRTQARRDLQNPAQFPVPHADGEREVRPEQLEDFLVIGGEGALIGGGEVAALIEIHSRREMSGSPSRGGSASEKLGTQRASRAGSGCSSVRCWTRPNPPSSISTPRSPRARKRSCSVRSSPCARTGCNCGSSRSGVAAV